MMLSSTKRIYPLLALLGLMGASLAGLPFLPPIPQDQAYHQFADHRTLLGIPNFWNVVSNVPSSRWAPWGCGNFGAIRQSSFFSLEYS